MQTSNPDYLFQSSAQLQDTDNRKRKRAAAAGVGSPLDVGKVIDLVIVGGEAYVAESGWQARRVDLNSCRTIRLYKGHKGPVTAVRLYLSPSLEGVPSKRYLFTSSWDKTIKIWDADNGDCIRTLTGHTDFVKSLTIIPGYLLSTSSDRSIKLWRLGERPLSEGLDCAQTLKLHSRPVDCSAVSQTENDDGEVQTRVWTADSMGVIHEWSITASGLTHWKTLKGHETSITQLLPTDDGLWSVSMDKTAIFHSAFSDDVRKVIPHESYIRSILPVPSWLSSHALLLTGGDDEDLTVRTSQDEWVTSRVLSTVQGHCDAVTAIKLWKDQDGNWKIVTGGLDGTLRRWTLQDLLHPKVLDWEPSQSCLEDSMMTAEEERELLKLMSDEE
ncbi:putative cytoplasm protein [Papiliotrema laurentii]|uniref:Cytoplasm protein n=1 Tax=Papiliotrema laurentii TaxID=5418 RepID=A0AAD9L7B5_PAPLA|nr:putative cytoplasm protein [Papiliotrema laurentii]